MRLICPHCMSGVTVPDDTAGKEAVCPSCGKPFPTPSRYTAAVSPDTTPPPGLIESSRMAALPEPPAPPGYIPPGQTPSPISAPPGYTPAPSNSSVGPTGFLSPSAPENASQTSGYTRSFSITISPKVVEWFPAVFLTLTFVLTFFPWAGSYIGGHAIYSQGPWRAIGGWYYRNLELEKVAPAMTVWQEKVKVPGDWLLIVPFLLLLILATAVAIAERVFQWVDPQKIPPNLWSKRHLIIAALSVAALTLLVIQSLNGFGLERAVQRYVKEEDPVLKMSRSQAQGNEWKLAMVQYEEDQELARFNLGRTTWMHLAVACTAIAVLAAIGNIILERRGDKPPPKLKVYY